MKENNQEFINGKYVSVRRADWGQCALWVALLASAVCNIGSETTAVTLVGYASLLVLCIDFYTWIFRKEDF